MTTSAPHFELVIAGAPFARHGVHDVPLRDFASVLKSPNAAPLFMEFDFATVLYILILDDTYE